MDTNKPSNIEHYPNGLVISKQGGTLVAEWKRPRKEVKTWDS